jgi:glutathione S-transferase
MAAVMTTLIYVVFEDPACRSPPGRAARCAASCAQRKVPVLVARGPVKAQAFVLTQSSAILFYADAAAPGRILPRHGDRARIDD